MASTTGVTPRLSGPVRGLGALLDFIAGSHLRAVGFLVLVSLVCFLPGFFNIPPIDRDEARFAQATKQMIESGDYIDIRFQDEVRYKKPVGVYWLQAGVVRAAIALGVPKATTTIWLYRIPSLIGAIGAVLATYWAALAFGTRRSAYLAALMLASSILLSVEARLAKTDAMLLWTIAAAMGVLARAYLEPQEGSASTPGWKRPAIFWTALAGGVLLKGPLIFMVVGFPAVILSIFDRSTQWLHRLRPAVGVVWLLVLVLPWFIAIVDRSGASFFVNAVGQDLLGKVASGQESHGAPPGIYLLLFWVTFWPGAPLAAMAAPAVWRQRREPPTRFLLAWLVPSWIVFELVLTKLPHYVLPLYPAIAILIARTIEQRALSANRHLARATLGWPIMAALLPVLAIISIIVLRKQLGLLAWPFGAAAIIFGFLAWRFYDTDGGDISLLRAVVAAEMISIAVFGAVMPLLRPLYPSMALASSIDADCENPLFASAGYQEPSLVFLLGSSTRLTDGQGAADFLGDGGCRFALIEARQERAFVQRAEAIGLRYAPGPRIEGIDYNTGRSIAVSVYRSESAR